MSFLFPFRRAATKGRLLRDPRGQVERRENALDLEREFEAERKPREEAVLDRVEHCSQNI